MLFFGNNRKGDIYFSFAFLVWLYLALNAPSLNGVEIILIASSLLFAVDILDRTILFIQKIKLKTENEPKLAIVQVDKSSTLPLLVSSLTTNQGGMFALLPCWVVAILIALIFTHF